MALNEEEVGRVTTGESVNPKSVAKLTGGGEAGVGIVEITGVDTGMGEGTVAEFEVAAVKGGAVVIVGTGLAVEVEVMVEAEVTVLVKRGGAG